MPTTSDNHFSVRLRTDPRAAYETIQIPAGELLSDLANRYQPQCPYRILAAKVGGELKELNKLVEPDSSVTLLDLRTHSANLMYQRSLCLLYMKAIDDCLGKTRVTIGNSLNKGLYTLIHRSGGVSADEVADIEKRMHELVARDIPLVKQKADRQTVKTILEQDGIPEKYDLLELTTEVTAFYAIDGFRDYFYGKMVPSTGYLYCFELRKYHNAVLLRFPHQSNPSKVVDYVDEKNLYAAFGEANTWGKLTGVSVVQDLNRQIENGGFTDLVLLSEALHEKSIAAIADRIAAEKKRIVLIAGPSSSGKTTFAKRLIIQLRVLGIQPLYLGTDDYYLEREDCPVDEHGEKNFENIDSLDLKLFNANMNDLLAGKAVDLPHFNFVAGKKIFGERITALSQSQPIIIEGIHGLNRQLTAGISDTEKFKIYISPLTALNIDDHNRIPTTDVRLLRRMIRDNRTRGTGAAQTILTWPKVREGEERNIFPFSNEADTLFNSAYIYELAVLKHHATELLAEIKVDDEAYSEAYRLRKFLQFFTAVEDDSDIPNHSILREFVGGSVIA